MGCSKLYHGPISASKSCPRNSPASRMDLETHLLRLYVSSSKSSIAVRYSIRRLAGFQHETQPLYARTSIPPSFIDYYFCRFCPISHEIRPCNSSQRRYCGLKRFQLYCRLTRTSVPLAPYLYTAADVPKSSKCQYGSHDRITRNAEGIFSFCVYYTNRCVCNS